MKKTIEEVIEQMCDDYCRYPKEWENKETDLTESDICDHCPLNRLEDLIKNDRE